MKTTRGFTLIEMLMVIVIIGIIIGIGIPMMNSLTRSTGLQGGIRNLSNTLHLARQYAITHRVRTQLKVNNTWNAVSVFINTTNQIDKWSFFPTGVVIGSNSVTSVTFKPTGDLASSSDQHFVIREGIYDTNTTSWIGMNKNLATVTVSYVLGRVRIITP